MTDSQVDGLTALSDRVTRAKRRVPPPRKPGGSLAPVDNQAAVSRPGELEEPDQTTTPNAPAGGVAGPSSLPSHGFNDVQNGTVQIQKADQRIDDEAPANGREALLAVLPDAPTVMLGARVRRPLDDALSDLVHDVRQHGVRTTKVELIEIALLSLVGTGSADVAEQVMDFRSKTGRYTGRR